MFKIGKGHFMPNLPLSVTRLALVLGITILFCVGPTSALRAQTPHASPSAVASRFTIDVVNVSGLIVLRSILLGAGQPWTMEKHVVSGLVTLHLHRAPYDVALNALLAVMRPQLVLRQDSSSGRAYTMVSLLHPPKPAPEPGPMDPTNSVGSDMPSTAKGVVIHPVTTPTQAIAAARAFLAKIHQPITVPGVAVFPAPVNSGNPNVPSPPSFYWHPRWLVTFPGQVTLEIARATGVIVYYSDYTLCRFSGERMLPDGEVVLNMTMRAAEAMRLARAVFRATGQQERGENGGGAGDLNVFGCGWQRTYHGIPYENPDEAVREVVNVDIDAHTRRILGVSFDYPSPPMTGPIGHVTQAQALQAAIRGAASVPAIAPGTVPTKAILRIVSLPVGGSLRTYAAWIVTFPDGPAHPRFFDDIWIDNVTGQVIADRHLGGWGAF